MSNRPMDSPRVIVLSAALYCQISSRPTFRIGFASPCKSCSESQRQTSSGADAPIDSSASTEAELASFNPVFQKILSDADSIRLQRNRELSYVDRSLVRNYALIAHMKDLRELRVQIQRGRNIVASSRDKFKKAFGEQYGQLTDDQAAVREEAQRFYAGVMEEYDAQEESLDGDECTLDLLEGNRDGWKVHNGKIIWIDPRLERSFRLFSRVAQ